MNPYDILDIYYEAGSDSRRILITHSEAVAAKAVEIAGRHPEMRIDCDFVYEAAMLHDVGVFMCDAPSIGCFGSEPYIRHGLLGAEILRQAGYERHARVCERHTGTGLTAVSILEQGLPLPCADFLPESAEEQLICFADKFFSKTHPDREKSVDEARRSLLRFGDESVRRFDEWCALFL